MPDGVICYVTKTAEKQKKEGFLLEYLVI